MAFKVGDKIRRTTDPVKAAPIGFETVVVEPKFGAGLDRVWYVSRDGDIVYGDVSAFELISESPIRTRREIVPGVYGWAQVDGVNENGAHIWLPRSRFWSAEALREAAHLFNQIAEVLEENAG